MWGASQVGGCFGGWGWGAEWACLSVVGRGEGASKMLLGRVCRGAFSAGLEGGAPLMAFRLFMARFGGGGGGGAADVCCAPVVCGVPPPLLT